MPAIITTLFLGTHDVKHLQCFIADPITHAFALWGAYDLRCDGVVLAVSKKPSDASGVST